MADELPNPVIKDEADPQMEKFLEAATMADKGQDIPSELVSPDAAQSEVKPDETEPEKKSDDRPRDALGRFTKTEDGKDIPESERTPAEAVPSKAKEPKPSTSEYEAKKAEKKQKEQERLEKTWESVNRRKEELEQRQRELEQREQQMRQQVQAPRGVQPQPRQYTSQQMWEAHQDFKRMAQEALKNGDYDAFGENQALADKAFEHANQFAQIEAQEQQQATLQQIESNWSRQLHEAFKANPDLKPGTPLDKEIQSVLEIGGNALMLLPDGFNRALEIAKLRLEAGSAGELRQQVKDLQAKLDKLNEQTSIGGGGVGGPPAPRKKFEDMSAEEQEAALMSAAEAMDQGR